MKTKTAIIVCVLLGILFGGCFWIITGALYPHSKMMIMRIGFTVALSMLGVYVGCVIQILSLGD